MASSVEASRAGGKPERSYRRRLTSPSASRGRSRSSSGMGRGARARAEAERLLTAMPAAPAQQPVRLHEIADLVRGRVEQVQAMPVVAIAAGEQELLERLREA